MRKLLFAPVALLIATIASAAVAAQGDVLSGTYLAKADGVKASVVVDESGDGRLRYDLSTSCGRAKGSLQMSGAPDGSLKGRRSSGGRSFVARLRPAPDAAELSGSIRYVRVKKHRDGSKATCRDKRTFDAVLDASSSPQVQSLAGHYVGSGQTGGRPINFDVGFDSKEGSIAISNMAFETDTECWQDLDGDGADDTLVARISGLQGEVDPDGAFSVSYTPDDDTEFYVDGTLRDGAATMDIAVGGFFATDGTPQAGGPLECDSFGETYTASR